MTTATLPQVLEGVTLDDKMNVADDVLMAQISHAIRQGHPQVWRQPEQPDRIALVGGGPSLADTEDELVQLVREGALLITVNGAYQWCLERNLHPHGHVVIDARPSTARFVTPPVPKCRYWVASQCHPDVWAAVADYEYVGIFHAVAPDADSAVRHLLDTYYAGHWQGIAGGTTVITRAMGLLRLLGYLRFDLFGVDSCWFGDQHHAFPQPENARDRRLKVTVGPSSQPDKAQVFTVSPWHLKQLEDFLRFWRLLGDQLLMRVHGQGLIAFALQASAELALSMNEE